MGRYVPVHRVFSEEELPALVAEWQDRLRLSDWMVKSEVRRERAMDKGYAGTIEMYPCKKFALIILLDPIDYEGSGDFLKEYDMEQVIVHELLHLHFDPFMEEDRESHRFVAQEVAIDAIAQALVQAKREP